jgi:hypothetical protein
MPGIRANVWRCAAMSRCSGTIGKFPGFATILKRRLLADPPDVFIGVDAPDFNLALERRAQAARCAGIHYVSPSIWAWRGKRIHKIGAAVSRVLALFPFEPALYEKEGIPVLRGPPPGRHTAYRRWPGQGAGACSDPPQQPVLRCCPEAGNPNSSTWPIRSSKRRG